MEVLTAADAQGSAWTSQGTFDGTTDQTSVVRLALPQPTLAHWVKLVVKEWHGHISLRWDVERE